MSDYSVERIGASKTTGTSGETGFNVRDYLEEFNKKLKTTSIFEINNNMEAGTTALG